MSGPGLNAGDSFLLEFPRKTKCTYFPKSSILQYLSYVPLKRRENFLRRSEHRPQPAPAHPHGGRVINIEALMIENPPPFA